ncbi:MAG: GNAT family N-acetyltransferase [Peptococcaceae bacterium]|jgi:ribosomal protein S18 acetylase RimI-like enzyme|nr:GNAT family N-acetyltransferase [Peptococcaceae bacterium]
MRIRLGKIQDWPFIDRLSKEAMADSIASWRGQPFKETLRYREKLLKEFRRWVQRTGAKILMAESGKEGEAFSIGYLVLYLKAEDELTGVRQGWIMDIGVLPVWRGKGVGTALIQEAERCCRDAGLSYLGLTVTSSNQRALNLYQSLNFMEERKMMVKVL